MFDLRSIFVLKLGMVWYLAVDSESHKRMKISRVCKQCKSWAKQASSLSLRKYQKKAFERFGHWFSFVFE